MCSKKNESHSDSESSFEIDIRDELLEENSDRSICSKIEKLASKERENILETKT